MCVFFLPPRFHYVCGVRGDAVAWGTALQVGRSRVRFPMVSLEFFIDTILPSPLWPWGWLNPQKKWVTAIFPWGGGGKGGRCVGLTTLPPSCADCHEIWEPQRSGTLRACPGPCRDCFILLNTHTHTHTHTHIYRVIQNYCRDFNNLSYAIHLR